MVWLLSARHDSAGLLFSGWRGAAVLHRQPHGEGSALRGSVLACTVAFLRAGGSGRISPLQDRKSTRLNSSHLGISYAVFCLKKKKAKNTLCVLIDILRS